MVEFTIKGRLAGLNEIIGSSRANRYQANKMKKDSMQEVMWFIPKKKITKPCEVHLTFYEPNNMRDCDNIISGGSKVILDALVLSGLLLGDSRRYVKQVHSLVYTDKKNPRIEVKIKEVEK